MRSILADTFDGKKLFVNLWDDVKVPKGAVLIAHGMAEHSGRYDDFAKYLNMAGYIVVADDERGHGQTAEKKGVVDGDSFYQTVEDKRMLVEYISSEYGLKTFLFGHSYGSFISQAFLEAYSRKIVGATLCGTTFIKNPQTTSGLIVSAFQKSWFGADKPAKLIAKLSFGEYDKKFEERTPDCWLSRDKHEVAKYQEDPFCGQIMSLGFYHSFFKHANALYGEAAKSIRKDIPILIAVGNGDPVSSFAKGAKKLYNFYEELGLDVSLKIYDGARHELLNETNKTEVYSDVLEFIEEAFKRS